MKTHDNGSLFTVSYTAQDAENFSYNWPGSTVRGSGSFQFQKSNGDLVDATGSASRNDGPEWLAFAQDCQKHGERQLAAIAKAKEKVTIQFEYTDTFGGEANYSWVRREILQLPADISDRALVRRAKAWAGLTGCRCNVSSYGDLIDIRPAGSCTVLFISTIY